MSRLFATRPLAKFGLIAAVLALIVAMDVGVLPVLAQSVPASGPAGCGATCNTTTAGSAAAPAVTLNSTTTGLYASGNNPGLAINGVNKFDYSITNANAWTLTGGVIATGGLTSSTGGLTISSGNQVLSASTGLYWNLDVTISRNAAGILQVGTSGANASGRLMAALLQTATVYSAAGTALPACNAGLEGTTAEVSDATSPAFQHTYASGGTVHEGVRCNGTNWQDQ